jgi:hypothetical protein
LYIIKFKYKINEAQKISIEVPPSRHHPRVPSQEWRDRD